MKDFLDNVPKTDSFAVPDGYFEELPDKIMAKVATDEVVSTLLSSTPPSTTFSVPESYFENLPDRVMARVQQVEAARQKSRKRLIFTVSAAASVVLIVSCTLFFFLNQPNTSQPTHLAENQKAIVTPKTLTDESNVSEKALAYVNAAQQNENKIVTNDKVSQVAAVSHSIDSKADAFFEQLDMENLDFFDNELIDYYDSDYLLTELMES